MLGRKETNSVPATLAQVKEILGSRSKEPDFGYEQQTCLDYANSFCKLTEPDALSLLGELKGVDGLSEEAAIKITDILPPCKSTLQTILAKDKIILDEAALATILELVGKASKKRISPPPKPAEEKPEAADEASENTPD
jgi:DNA-directed RNA polymerase subunit F